MGYFAGLSPSVTKSCLSNRTLTKPRRDALKVVAGASLGLAAAAWGARQLSANRADGNFVNFSEFSGFEAAGASGVPVHFDPGDYSAEL